MKIKKILDWLDSTLNVKAFDDVSNNGLQIARTGDETKRVAFAVDASRRSVVAAGEAGAQLLVVHHGISWGGGIKRIVGSEFAVVQAAIDRNLALYAVHLPLDAHPKLGHNALIAKSLKLKHVRPAFSYHGNVIGCVGTAPDGAKVGVCSGGAGEFAVEAKALGCDRFITGEASWGEMIAAENVGMKIDCWGHYDTEIFGIKALAEAMRDELKIETLTV